MHAPLFLHFPRRQALEFLECLIPSPFLPFATVPSRSYPKVPSAPGAVRFSEC
jgi:hypothetical protein